MLYLYSKNVIISYKKKLKIIYKIHVKFLEYFNLEQGEFDNLFFFLSIY